MPSSPLVPWLSVRESTEAVAGKDPQSRLGSADRCRPPPSQGQWAARLRHLLPSRFPLRNQKIDFLAGSHEEPIQMVCMSAFFTATFNMYANAGRLRRGCTVTRGAPLKRRPGARIIRGDGLGGPDRWGAGTETNDGLL